MTIFHICEMNTLTLAALVLVTQIVYFLSPNVQGSPVCDKHCIHRGCTRRGAGKCDRFCLPQETWRLRVFDHTCQPRCGGNCLYCRSHYWCDVCWEGYWFEVNKEGSRRVCRKFKCDENCESPRNCNHDGKCNGPCKTGYVLRDKDCYPAIDCHPGCLSSCTHAGYCDPAGAPGTTRCKVGFGPTTPTGTLTDLYVSCAACDPNCAVGDTCNVGAGRCDDTCVANYYVDGPSHFCTDCDQHCTPIVPGDCDFQGTCKTSCVTGWVLFDVIQLCLECPTGCATCTTDPSEGCRTCLLTTVQDEPTCSACDVQCTSGCVTPALCDPSSGTPTCNPGYGPTTSGPQKCGECDPNCAVSGIKSGCNMNKSGFCDGLCNDHYVYVPSTKQCTPCQTPDISFCSRCETPGYCTQCAAGYSATATPGTCQLN